MKDQYCDDENNKEECMFDGGDCCAEDRLVNCVKCECLEP